MSTVGIVGTSPQVNLPWGRGGCDLPEQGGIGGNIRPDEPLPGVLEERNKTYNWKTGEWEYTDNKCPEGCKFCYDA